MGGYIQGGKRHWDVIYIATQGLKKRFIIHWLINFDKTMADKLMYITNDEIKNYPICRIQLMVKML